jgi:hypothetical protein
VGAVDGENAFAGVSDVAARSAGGMWVLDGRSHMVSGYDDEGALAVRFGGEGDGPGELQAARAVFEADSGRLAVGVPYPPALHWYRDDGEYLESERLSDMRDPQGNPLAPAFADWSVTTTGGRFVHLFEIPRPGGRSRVDHTVLWFGRDGPGRAARDTVIRWSLPATPSDPGAPLPMVPVTPKWATGPDDQVWWSPGSPYEIRVLDAAGNPLRSITLDREAVEVDSRLRTSIARGLMRSAREQVGDVGLVESALARARWPEQLPHLAGLWVSSPTGRVFAAPYTEASFDRGAEMLLDVFEADGRYSGTLSLPPGFSPRRFSDGSVFGVATDDLGLHFAVRYSIVR